MSVRIVTWSASDKQGAVLSFLARPAFDEKAEKAASEVLSAIRSGGDRAVLAYVRKFDGLDTTPAGLRVPAADFAAARKAVSPTVARAIREADKRVAAFARAGIRKNWTMPSPRGGFLGEQFTPLDRVGVYIPGGTAPLASTVVMTVTLARVAGVPEIVVCTPCGQSGKIHPALLYAMELAGATEVYRVGGIQAIGAMAYGMKTVRKVQKIVGPGNAYVTAAKKQVYGQVALDLVAGPSEIAILADDSADARYVAADLLSQAEHGSGHEKAVLVTTSGALARKVQAELERQAPTLSRYAMVRKVMDRGMLIVRVKSLDDGVALCNRIAVEHLEIMTRNPRAWARKVRCAGAIFVGPWTPEPAGDFAAGPSHVLPTGGTAAMFSGLTVDDFRRRSSVISLTRADLREVRSVIETFASIEGLDAHGRCAGIRFEKA